MEALPEVRLTSYGNWTAVDSYPESRPVAINRFVRTVGELAVYASRLIFDIASDDALS